MKDLIPERPAARVVVFGSFDLLHQGHRYFLQQAGQHGQVLAVLASDAEIYLLKQRQPAQGFALRQETLLASGLVAQVLPSDPHHGTFSVLQAEDSPTEKTLVLLGDGQEELGRALENFFCRLPQFRCPVVHVLPRYRGLFSSTRLHQLRTLAAYAALLGAMLFWASGWVMGKLIATSSLAAPLASTLRLSLLALFFLLWNLLGSLPRLRPQQKAGRGLSALALVPRKSLAQGFAVDRKNLCYLLLSGLAFVVHNLCLFYGLQVVFANQGGVLTSVFIPIFSALLHSFRERLSKLQLLGLVLGLVSGAVLLGGLRAAQVLAPVGKEYWRLGLFVLAALSWSCITQLSSKIQEDYSLSKYSLYAYLFAAVLSSWGWLWYVQAIPWTDLLVLLLLVFLGSIVGTSLYFLALRSLRPNHVASFLFLNPVFILLMSWLLLSEPWTTELSIGGILAFVAIILLNYRRA